MRARSAIPDGDFFSFFLPSLAEHSSERPGAVQGAPDWGAAERTLDGEDRSERIVVEGRTTRFTHDSGRFDPQILLQSHTIQIAKIAKASKRRSSLALPL